MTRTTADARHADVIVVGAGPAGASAAYHLANAGVDVLLLEKSAFPRDKICGDGLTPRAVRQLVGLGLDLDAPGWQKNHGLRIVGAGHRLELPWPDLASFPPYGLVRTRMDLDEILARHAEKAGARLMERTAVTGPVVDERTGRVDRRDARSPSTTGVAGSATSVDLPRARRDRGRRRLRPARHRAGPRAAREPADGGRGPRLLRDPPPRRRLDGVLARALGRHARTSRTCCRATAGSSVSGTAPPTSASAS